MKPRILLAALLTLAAGCKAPTAPAPKAYHLTVLASVNGIPVPVGTMLVQRVTRQVDGSICFERVDTGLHGCVKLIQYDLAEAELQ